MLEEDFSDIEELIDSMDLSELDPSDDDIHLFEFIYTEDEQELDEGRVLNVQQRMKIGQRMKRLSKRFTRLRKIKSRRMAPTERLKYRSRKAAIMSLRARVSGQRGKKYSQLSPQQRVSVDQMVSKKFGKNLSKIIARGALRALPKIRKKEMIRLNRVRSSINSEVEYEIDVELKKLNEVDMEKSPEDIEQDKKLKVATGFKGDIERLDIDKEADLHLTPFSKKRKDVFKRLNNSVEYSIAEAENEKVNTKFDTLMRYGLVDAKTINRYRAALRGGEKSLANPELRKRILTLLDRLIDLSTKDNATYNRLRTTVRKKVDENLQKKSDKSGIAFEILKEVYTRGLLEHNDPALAFNRVNSFVSGGAAIELDADLIEGAAENLSRAFDRERAKSELSRKYAKDMMKKFADDWEKKQAEKKAAEAVPKVNEEESECNHSKKGIMCEVHGMKNCAADIQEFIRTTETKYTGQDRRKGPRKELDSTLPVNQKGSEHYIKRGRRKTDESFAKIKLDAELSEVTGPIRVSARREMVHRVTKKGTRQFTRRVPLKPLAVTNIASRSTPVTSAAGAKRNLFRTARTYRRLYNSYDPTDVSETAGEDATTKLRKRYSKDTPGQNEELNIAPFSAEKSWVDEKDENMNTGKSLRTYQDIRNALSGKREIKNDK